MYQDSCWANGSFFRPSASQDNYLHCVHSSYFGGNVNGGWLYPDGTPCTDTSDPLQCNNVTTDDGPIDVTLERVGEYSTDIGVFTCCLPTSCDDESSNIIANIYSK